MVNRNFIRCLLWKRVLHEKFGLWKLIWVWEANGMWWLPFKPTEIAIFLKIHVGSYQYLQYSPHIKEITLDFSKGDYGEAYQTYIEFYPSYGCQRHPLLDYRVFNHNLFVIDCSAEIIPWNLPLSMWNWKSRVLCHIICDWNHFEVLPSSPTRTHTQLKFDLHH